MKLSTKTISSPGRAEKYPPPLMRFLRSNVGSRSRGRSRSSPMFVRKKNAAAAAIETREPSSPKVTCMGQVRVKRSKQQPKTRRRKTKRRCKWIRNVLFCHHFAGKVKPKCSKPAWPKWVMFFHLGFKRKSKIREDSSKIESKFSNRSEDLEQEIEEEDEEREAKVHVSTAISPPKNALLLTRSRSAPYRSSSLASKFWGSPFGNEETEQKQSIEQENTEDDTPSSKRETLRKESDPEIEEKLSFFKENEDKIINLSKIEEFRTEEDGIVRPLILPRCKSEPARIAEKLDPEMSFWKKRRLGFT